MARTEPAPSPIDPDLRILAVESSCDETAVAVVEGGRTMAASVVASQTPLHAPTGGIVPIGTRFGGPPIRRGPESAGRKTCAGAVQ